MKKITALFAAGALALGGVATPAYAGSDEGDFDLVRGWHELGCYLLGLENSCRWLAENPPPPPTTPTAPGR